jgi:hypothetical protein
VRVLIVRALIVRMLIVRVVRMLVVIPLILIARILILLLRLLLMVRALRLRRLSTVRKSILVGLADQAREFGERIALGRARSIVIIARVSALGTIWISIRHLMRSPSGGQNGARSERVQRNVSSRCMSRRPTTTGSPVIAFRPAPGHPKSQGRLR